MDLFACRAVKQTNKITDQSIDFSRVPPGNPTVPKLANQLPALDWIWNIIISNSWSVGPILSQLYPLHALLFYLDIILPSTPTLSKWSLSFRLIPSPMRATCPLLFIFLDIIRITCFEKCKSLKSSCRYTVFSSLLLFLLRHKYLPQDPLTMSLP